MAADPRKRQRKLERRATKRKEKKHLELREQSQGVRQRIEAASRFPILHCAVSNSLWETGMGWVLLSRGLPDGSVAAAIFLVDRHCLGVKDAIAAVVSRFDYESDFWRKIHDLGAKTMAPPDARKLVESAIEYARNLGIAPHTDYHKAKPIFGDIDAGQATQSFEFGQGGKPFFVAGPHDSRQRCHEILATLERSCGPGGYEFLVPIPGDVGQIARMGDTGDMGAMPISDAEFEDGEADFEDDEEE
jgi:hypothetical protein